MSPLQRYNTDERLRQVCYIRNGMSEEAMLAEITRAAKALDVQDGAAEVAADAIIATTNAAVAADDADRVLGKALRGLIPAGVSDEDFVSKVETAFTAAAAPDASSTPGNSFRETLMGLFTGASSGSGG